MKNPLVDTWRRFPLVRRSRPPMAFSLPTAFNNPVALTLTMLALLLLMMPVPTLSGAGMLTRPHPPRYSGARHPDIALRQSDQRLDPIADARSGVLILHTMPRECVIECVQLGIEGEEKRATQWMLTGVPEGDYEFVFDSQGEQIRDYLKVDAGLIRRYAVNFLIDRVDDMTYAPDGEGCFGDTGRDEPMSLDRDQGIEPKLLLRATPRYSKEARDEGVEGRVLIRVLVNEAGRVQAACVEEGVQPVLDNAALDAAFRSEFEPVVYLDRPVRAWAHIKFLFSAR